MIFKYISNRNFISPSYSASIISEARFYRFLIELKKYLNDIEKLENEEMGKTPLRNLIFSTGFNKYKIEPIKNSDLAIYEDRDDLDKKQIEVFIETKIPNSHEMIKDDDFKKKAFAQICFYADKEGTSSLKHLIVTDYKNLYIFKSFDIKRLTSSATFPKYNKKAKTEDIYLDILNWLDNLLDFKLEYTKVDFSKFEIEKIKELEENIYSKDERIFNLRRELTGIYKLLSPQNLLELNFGKDMNSLDDGFYRELLYIFGVEEREDSDGILKILRKFEHERSSGSILELTICENSNLDFEDVFELNIIWLNRILFLKLLEARLIFMHPNFKPFMNLNTIHTFRQLENLFFEVMAKEISERKDSLKIFENIPYMNSSLFNKKDIEIMFFGIKDLDSAVKIKTYQTSNIEQGEFTTLDYLFRFLNSYDFGSNKFDEIAPIDKTLIKSSVLGLIFEKVNGYKDGSHFTPSFITQKLAKDSLDNFFGNLEKIKILDPAVGSGHILVSVMNELVVRQATLEDEYGEQRIIKIENDEIFISDEVQYISNEKNIFPTEATRIQKKMFELKKRIIENNIFGVDINSKSVEIARLRLWIELLKWSFYSKKTGKFTVLPNLDINIKVGNSLVSRFALNENIAKIGKEKIAKLQELGHLYFQKSGIEKIDIEKEIKSIKNSFSDGLKNNDPDKKKIIELIENYLSIHGEFGIEHFYKNYTHGVLFIADRVGRNYKNDLKAILELHEKIDFLDKLPHSFEWRFEFPDVLNEHNDFVGFDFVIANPPYIRQERIKDLKPILEKKFKVYNGTADIYTYFFELGRNLLVQNGILSFIVSNKWTRAKYGENLRNMLLNETQILQYVEYNGIKVFDSATVDASIISFKKVDKVDKNLPFDYCTAKERKEERTEDFRYFDYKCIDFLMSDLSIDSFSFANQNELKIKKQIEKIGIPLKNWDIKINYGIKTGFNEAFIISTEQRNEILDKCTSSIERERTEKIIKKVLRGRDIKRYSYEWADLWIINFHNNPPLQLEDYPAIKQHFDQFYKQLHKRTDQGATPYNLRNCAYLNEFEKEKIIYPNMAKSFVAIYDEQHFFTNQKCFFITGTNLKYLTALLNSKGNFFYFKQIGATLGATGYEMSKIFVEQLPIPKPTEKSEKVLTTLVEYVLFAKENKMQQESEYAENVIDIVVFGLYFEENMKKADCYILDYLFEHMPNSQDNLYEFLLNDTKIKRSLIDSYILVDEVKLINQKT